MYIEPDIIPNNPPKWMTTATFTQRMYSNICVAIIRPGVGSITDALSTGARVFTFFEKNNLEMLTNAKIIQSAGVGRNSFNIESAWRHACEYCSNSDMQDNQKINIDKINFNGAENAAQLLLI